MNVSSIASMQEKTQKYDSNLELYLQIPVGVSVVGVVEDTVVVVVVAVVRFVVPVRGGVARVTVVRETDIPSRRGQTVQWGLLYHLVNTCKLYTHLNLFVPRIIMYYVVARRFVSSFSRIISFCRNNVFVVFCQDLFCIFNYFQ